MKLKSNAYEGREKLPTFLQWCKETQSQKTALVYYVNKLWLPGMFPDLTLQTTCFRLRVHHKSPLFEAIMSELTDWIGTNTALAVTGIDKELFDFEIDSETSETATWSALGESGFMIEIEDKPTRKATKAKKPLA